MQRRYLGRKLGFAFCFMRAHYSKETEIDDTTDDTDEAPPNPFDFSRTREKIESNVKEAIEKSDQTYVKTGQKLDILTSLSPVKPIVKGKSRSGGIECDI